MVLLVGKLERHCNTRVPNTPLGYDSDSGCSTTSSACGNTDSLERGRKPAIFGRGKVLDLDRGLSYRCEGGSAWTLLGKGGSVVGVELRMDGDHAAILVSLGG